jgi:hypothetical protein
MVTKIMHSDERPYWWSLAPAPGSDVSQDCPVEDEDLVTSREEGDRHMITLTSEGRAQLEERSAGLGDLFADFADAPTRPDPPDRLSRVHAALCQIEVGGDATQLEAAANGSLLARRSLYLILASERRLCPLLLLARVSQLADRFSTAEAQPRF